MSLKIPISPVVVAFLLLAGCTTPSPDAALADEPITQQDVRGGNGKGGGAVANAPPQSRTLSAGSASGANDGTFTVVMSGTVFDPNGEQDIAAIQVLTMTPIALSYSKVITPAVAMSATEPSSFDVAGWKVWTGAAARDGVVAFQFRYSVPAFAASGTYDFRAVVTDLKGAVHAGPVASVDVQAFSRIEVSATPVRPDGTPDTTSGWGAWNVTPGATEVTSTNFLKIVNSGDVPDARVVIDFNEGSMVGATDAEWNVPIDGNLRFTWWEDTTPTTSAPAEGTYALLDPSAEGAVTVSFTGRSNIIYVGYTIIQMPHVLADQPYSASFTATEL